MLTGSYEAGIAFTNAYVGYVHAIAHGIGGLYHVPHGEANAILLPKVLAAYGSAVYEPLARLERKVRSLGEAGEGRGDVRDRAGEGSANVRSRNGEESVRIRGGGWKQQGDGRRAGGGVY